MLKDKAKKFIKQYFYLILMAIIMLTLLIIILRYFGGRLINFVITSIVLMKILTAGR